MIAVKLVINFNYIFLVKKEKEDLNAILALVHTEFEATSLYHFRRFICCHCELAHSYLIKFTDKVKGTSVRNGCVDNFHSVSWSFDFCFPYRQAVALTR